MAQNNEGKVCDSILRYLEARHNVVRQNVERPETENHPDPVELTFALGEQIYALEHTRIEPFEGYLALNAQAPEFVGPIQNSLQNTLPDGCFEMHIPFNAVRGLNCLRLQSIQRTIIDWVNLTALSIPVRRYDEYIGDIAPSQLEGVPFPVILYRFETFPKIPRFSIKHIVADDVDSRIERMRRACDAKFPKLDAWRRKEGARTVLVLENLDIQLTNQSLVAEAYLQLALVAANRPDETYLVMTCMDPWCAWPILVDAQSYFDNPLSMWQIAPESLQSITDVR